MRTEPASRLRGTVLAIALAIVVLLLAYACMRSAMVRSLPVDAPTLTILAPDDPDVTIARGTLALVAQRGILSPEMLAGIRRAAQAAPLDARAYLVLGHQQLLDDKPTEALRTLEAAQRLDPRNRLIHLLLLDRYLRTGRFADAAGQFAISSRLIGPAQGPIAKAMAQMSLAPETRDAVRRTLAGDPALERGVLITLARSDTAPATVFALASPSARQDAGQTDSWGPVLIARLVDQGRYGTARDVWRRVYGVTAAQAAAPVFDADFRELPGSAPFNWTLVASSLGAADILNGTLTINYYGRDTGTLASQMLVLAPGAYRFAITVEGTKTGPGPSLSWSLRCATGAKPELMNLSATATGASRRTAASFTVPAGCAAQQLALIGGAGEFPAPITLMLRDLDLRPAGTVR